MGMDGEENGLKKGAGAGWDEPKELGLTLD